MTASVEALPLSAPSPSRPTGRRLPGHHALFSDDEATLARFAHAPDASFDKAAGWLYRRHGRGLPRRRRAPRDRRRRPVAARRPGRGEGRPRQPGALDGLPAGAGTDRQLRHQLDHRLGCDARPGPGPCSPTCPRTVAVARLWDAIFAASRVDGADPVAAWAAHNDELHARARRSQRPPLRGLALPRAGHRPHRRPRRRPRVVRRRVARQERHRLQSQHPDRGGLHHAAQGPRRRPSSPSPSRCPTRAR